MLLLRFILRLFVVIMFERKIMIKEFRGYRCVIFDLSSEASSKNIITLDSFHKKLIISTDFKILLNSLPGSRCMNSQLYSFLLYDHYSILDFLGFQDVLKGFF